MERLSPFSAQQLTAIAKVLGDTDTGLSGSEIGFLLRDAKLTDVDPLLTKWKRLYNAFAESQNSKQMGNHVVMFITRAMNPVQFMSRRDVYEHRRQQLNVALAFCGMEVTADGKIRHAAVASSLDEAHMRADRLYQALKGRSVHADVLSSCKAELLVNNYFHAVFEAMKSIAVKIRSMSGLTLDGAELVQQAFSLGGGPVLAINALVTETDRGEQRGFVNLLVGLFGTIRNPLAHNPKADWDMSEQDALDVLTMASLVHRKLDKARRLAP